MSETPNLALPYIEAAQAQKHVTHNEALRSLDAIVQLSVIDRDLTTPPGDPANGDRYLVAAGAAGDWTGKDFQIAAWQDGVWVFHVPRAGWLCWVADEDLLLAWDGAEWRDAGTVMGGVAEAETFGINATANATNRLVVASPAVLLNHEGAGHQLKINKNLPADTASVLFQTGLSGRAEMGLAGSNDYSFKVSPDGGVWHDAITIDRTTGEVSFPNTSIGGGGGGSADAIEFVIDGGGSAITTGVKGFLEVPWDCTVTRATLVADQSGDIVIDVWADTYANAPPDDAGSITASAPPTLSGAQTSQDSTLSGWTTALNAGDIIGFNVDSVSTVERVTLSLAVTKT